MKVSNWSKSKFGLSETESAPLLIAIPIYRTHLTFIFFCRAKVFVLAALIAVVASQGYKPSYPAPPAYPSPAYPSPPAYPKESYVSKSITAFVFIGNSIETILFI